jgi:hypothetical protein
MSLPSVLHSVNELVTESRTLPSDREKALGKGPDSGSVRLPPRDPGGRDRQGHHGMPCRRGDAPRRRSSLRRTRSHSTGSTCAGPRGSWEERHQRPLPPSSTSAPALRDLRTPAEARRRRPRCCREAGCCRLRPRLPRCCGSSRTSRSSLLPSDLDAGAALVASNVTRVESLSVSSPTCAGKEHQHELGGRYPDPAAQAPVPPAGGVHVPCTIAHHHLPPLFPTSPPS